MGYILLHTWYIYVIMCHVKWVPDTTAWCVLGQQMETASKFGG